MNEEEIIYIIEELKEAVRYKTIIANEEREEWKREYNALQGLLDLYKQEKEKNKQLEEIIDEHRKTNKVAEEKLGNILKIFESKNNLNNYISKDKIREKIEEIESNEQYNWVGSEWSESEVVGMLEDLLEEE